MDTYPIQFSIPTNRIQDSLGKDLCFSHISPGITKYSFNSESEYYQHYGRCYFAVTMKKSGWDCLRHYEILGSGCIPYFLDLECCPPNTMFRLPKDLLLKARGLPGMPSYEKVLSHVRRDDLGSLDFDWNKFDIDKYHSLLDQLALYTKKYLTTKSMAEYFLSKLSYDMKKVLFISSPKRIRRSRPYPSVDYQRDLLFIGLIEAGIDVYSTSNLFWLYDDASGKEVRETYGRGFTVTMNIPAEKRKAYGHELRQRLESKSDDFDAVIVSTSSNKGFDDSWDKMERMGVKDYMPYLTEYDKEKMIWIDGTDIDFWEQGRTPSVCGVAFRREMR